MTVTTNTNKVQALGNGATTNFPYAFRIYAATDLIVTVTDLATGVDSVKVLNTDYTVTGAGSYNGGNVVFSVAPASNARVTIRREVSLTQGTDLRNQGAYYAETHEDVFDRLVMIDQQQQETLARSLTLPASSSGVSAQLPNPVGSQVIGWDEAGTALKNYGPVDNTLLAVDLSDSVTLTKGVAMIGGAGRVVSSIAALRALPKTGSKNASVTGYYAAGDGGGGLYYYDAADTTSADNGGTIIVATDGGRWKLADQHGISVKQFGAKCDGNNDDTAAINLALSSGASRVLFNTGAIKVSGPLYYRSGQEIVFDRGAVIQPTALAGWSALSLNGVDWGYAIFVNQNWQSSTLDDTDITFTNPRCEALSAWNGHFIMSRRVQNLTVNGSVCVNMADVVSSMYCKDVMIDGGWCMNITNCAYDFWESPVNVTVRGCRGYVVNAGVNFNAIDTFNAVGHADNCLVDDCYFYLCATAGVFVAPLGTDPASTVKNVTIRRVVVDQNNQVPGGGASYNGITVQNTKGVTIEDCWLSRIGSAAYPIIVSSENGINSTGAIVAHNHIIDSNIGGAAYIAAFGPRARVAFNEALNSTGSVGIVVSDSASYVTANDMTGATTHLANQDQSGAPTTAAMEYRVEPGNRRHRFLQAVATDFSVQQGVDYGISATGTNLATARALTKTFNFISSGSAGTGVSLPANATHLGEEWVIWNSSGSDKIIYAASGETIGGSASITVSTSNKVRLVAVTGTLWMQA